MLCILRSTLPALLFSNKPRKVPIDTNAGVTQADLYSSQTQRVRNEYLESFYYDPKVKFFLKVPQIKTWNQSYYLLEGSRAKFCVKAPRPYTSTANCFRRSTTSATTEYNRFWWFYTPLESASYVISTTLQLHSKSSYSTNLSYFRFFRLWQVEI